MKNFNICMSIIIFLIVNLSFSYGDELFDRINNLYNSNKINKSLELLIKNIDRVKKNPDLYGKLVFNYDDETLTKRFNLTEDMNKVIKYLNKNMLDKSSMMLLNIIEKYPLYYPAYGLLTTIFLKGNVKYIKKVIDKVPVPMKLTYTAAYLYEQGKTKRAAITINKLVRHKEYKNYIPMYKVFGMFPESIVDFKEKADFKQKYMMEIKKFKYDSILEIMLENGIVSALESKFACRRNREEIQNEIFMYITPEGKPRKELNKSGKHVMKCPSGVRYLLKTTPKSEYKIFCPIHGDD